MPRGKKAGGRGRATLVTTPSGLIALSDLTYQGAFKFPHTVSGGDSFAYSDSSGIAYNPANDSLFAGGAGVDVVGQKVCELTIPALVNNGDATLYSELNEAAVLQTFVEPSEGQYTTEIGDITNGVALDLFVYDGKLILQYAVVYDAGSTQVGTFFKRPLNLSATGSVEGIFTLSSTAQMHGTSPSGRWSKYSCPVPSAWQSLLGGTMLSGQHFPSIIGRMSYGPGAFAHTPDDYPGTATPTTHALLYYDDDPRALSARAGYATGVDNFYWTSTNPLWNAKSHHFLVFPEGYNSLLYIGRNGTGTFEYGVSAPSGAINDPEYPSESGNHCYPYQFQILAYDAATLAEVKAGTRQHYDVLPYANWTFTLPADLATRGSGVPLTEIKGATYKPSTKQIFLKGLTLADGAYRPVIHVFSHP